MNSEDQDNTPESDLPRHEIEDEGDGPFDFDAVGDAASLRRELDAVKAERNDFENRMLRIAADYQNFVRRSEQNIAAAREQEIMSVAKSLVTVMDHFDLALTVDAEQISAADLMKGAQLVRDELLRTLQNFGVQRIEAERGEAFDPNRHEALMRQAVEDLESDQVAMQLQPGYVLNDKTIRAVKVAVAE